VPLSGGTGSALTSGRWATRRRGRRRGCGGGTASRARPGSLLDSLSCDSIRPGHLNRNPSFFCDRRVDAQIARALKIQATDPDAAVRLWRRIERELVDLASWVPLFTPQAAHLVSRRVRDYQYNLSSRILFDQLWMR
jgi:ABC-type transport system substrate-binding protein